MEEQPIKERKERESEGVVRITNEIKEKIKYLSRFFKSRFLVYIMGSQAVFFTGKMGEVHARSLDRFLNNGPTMVEYEEDKGSNKTGNTQLADLGGLINITRDANGRIRSIGLLWDIITIRKYESIDPEERLLELAILAKKLTLEHNDINKIRNFFNRENATFTISSNNVSNLGGIYNRRYSNIDVVQDYTLHLVTNFLGETFNMRNVIDSAEYVVDNISVDIIPGYESLGSGSGFSMPRERFSTQGRRYESLRYVQAIVNIKIYDVKTREIISLVAYGIPIPHSYNSRGTQAIFIRNFSTIVSKQGGDFQELAAFLAIANAIDNLKSIFCFSGKKELGYYEHFDPNSVPVTMVSFNKDNRPDSQT